VGSRIADRIALAFGAIAAFLEGFFFLKIRFISLHTVEDPSAYLIAVLAYALVGWILFRLICLLVPRKAASHPVALAMASSILFWVLILGGHLASTQPFVNRIAILSIGSAIAVWLVYYVSAHFSNVTRTIGFFSVILSLILLVGCLLQAFVPSYWWDFFERKENGRPNIILVTLDTLRADHLSFYGYPVETSPFLRSLAKQGVLFRNAYTSATWTLPAHGSLFTGQMPSVNGLGFKNFFLSDDANTLAEILKQQGYTTAGFIGGPFLVSAFRINQGFDYYNEHLDEHSKLKRFSVFRIFAKLLGRQLWETNGQRSAADINSELFPYLDWVRDRGPFFIFINYFDAHDPYDPPQRYRELLYPGKITWEKGNLRSLFIDKKTGIALFPDGKPLKEKDFQQLRYLYDAEIRYLDDQISRLWNKLQRRGFLENTIVLFVADHGETLGEHGFLDHGHLLYQEQVRIPFFVVGPGSWSGGKKIEEPVRIVDVFPTLLEQLRIPRPENVQGRSLLPLLGRKGGPEMSVFAELDADPHPRYLAFRKDQKMILKNNNKFIETSTGENSLTNIVSDPEEMKNLIEKNPELAAILQAELGEYFSHLLPAHPVTGHEMDEESKEKLKALGYIE
jgi:arylsulfatase A-like enzyme